MPESSQDHNPKPSSNETPENASIEGQKETQAQKTREQIKEELKNMTEDQLVSRMVSLLKRKYPDNAEAFSKETVDVWDFPKLYATEGTRLYLQYSKDGKLLSYLDNRGETLLDMTRFLTKNPTRFKNKLYAKWIEKDGKRERVDWIIEEGDSLFYIDEKLGKHKEGSEDFNIQILFTFLFQPDF